MNKEKGKKTGVHCVQCNTYIPNEASLNAHLKGKKHLKNVDRIKSWESTAERSLYIAGIEFCYAVELQLADYFSQFGSISKITIDKDAGHFAILEFSDRSSAQMALEEPRHLIGSHHITVKPREVKIPLAKKNPNQHRVVHNQMSSEVWNAVMEACDVDDQFQTLQNLLSLTADDIHLRELICKFLHSAFVEVFPSCQIQPFGSSVNGFGVHGCDLDLNFKYDSIDYDAALQFLEPQNGGDFKTPHDPHKKEKSLSVKEIITVIANIIKQCIPDCHKVKAILSARRPVVRFHHKASDMCCDISVGNNLAVRNTLYLKLCCDQDAYFASLVQVVRSWMKHWNLAGSQQAASPRLNNYAVTLLVLFYLHNCEHKRLQTLDEQRSSSTKLRPCLIENWDCSFSEDLYQQPDQTSQSLSELLSGFFKFYSKLDFSKYVLCLKSGELQEISTMNLRDQDSIGKEHITKKFFKYGALNIQDPFDLDHNVAGNVGQKHMFVVTKCIRNAALSCDMKLFHKKPGTKKEPWGILNLFIDHHTKTEPKTSIKNVSGPKTTYSFQISKKNDVNSSSWCEDVVSMIITVLSDVFLMKVKDENESMLDPECDENDKSPAENSVACCATVKVQQTDNRQMEDVDEENSEMLNMESRKRTHATSPIYHKRARLALSSPEVSHLKHKAKNLNISRIEFPYQVQCEATYRLWEGRRKARRQLVQPGMGDILDLERQVSKLLLSESTVETPGTSDVNTSQVSNCSVESYQTQFQFSLMVMKVKDDSVQLSFDFESTDQKSEKDFQNFFHHMEIFLPRVLAKCNKVAS